MPSTDCTAVYLRRSAHKSKRLRATIWSTTTQTLAAFEPCGLLLCQPSVLCERAPTTTAPTWNGYSQGVSTTPREAERCHKHLQSNHQDAMRCGEASCRETTLDEGNMMREPTPLRKDIRGDHHTDTSISKIVNCVEIRLTLYDSSWPTSSGSLSTAQQITVAAISADPLSKPRSLILTSPGTFHSFCVTPPNFELSPETQRNTARSTRYGGKECSPCTDQRQQPLQSRLTAEDCLMILWR